MKQFAVIASAMGDATRGMALRARAASRILRALPASTRTKMLERVADSLMQNKTEILDANALDLAAAQEASLAPALVDRLALSEKKLSVLAAGVRQLSTLEDPIGKVMRRTELADGLVLEQETVPIGVLLVIFESRPDALVQVAALSVRSGNSVLLKGGREARNSLRVLHRVVADAISSDGIVGSDLVALVESRESVESLLAHSDVIDLVIPRGSGAMVKHIQSSTRIPVLGHADGVCHVFVDASADPTVAIKVVVDSKTDYPAACNAMETLLLHESVARSPLGQDILDALRSRGVTLNAGPKAVAFFPSLAPTDDLRREYSDMEATVEVVLSLQDAVEHINKYGSGHTDAIITTDDAAADRFRATVDSACVFHNASTRFADGYRFGLGAEVGIATGRIHARGPVGVDGLLTTKWTLRGSGQGAADFANGGYAHRTLPL